MSVVSKLETTVAGWLKSMPHLPKGGQKWLAENVWWLAIISVAASAISLLIAIGAIVAYTTLFGAAAGYYSYGTQTYTSGWIVMSLISLLFSIATTVLMAVAISPLKKLQKKGWNLLFLTLIVNAVAIIVNAVVSLNPITFIFSIIFGAIWLGIAAYFLFEIRSYYSTAKATSATKK